jgi:hypothetical protein
MHDTSVVCTMADSGHLVNTTQAARILGLKNPGTLVNWRRGSRGPTYIRVGRCVRYDLQDLGAWIDQQRIDMTKEIAGLLESAKDSSEGAQ